MKIPKKGRELLRLVISNTTHTSYLLFTCIRFKNNNLLHCVGVALTENSESNGKRRRCEPIGKQALSTLTM